MPNSFQSTEGPGTLHLSDVEQDKSSQKFQLQISVPVVDGGVDAETLEK